MTFPPIDETHDPARKCWVPGSDRHADFPIQNLPLGIARFPGGGDRAVMAIGDQLFDLPGAAAANLLPCEVVGAVDTPTLNALFALPADARRALRRRVSDLLSDPVHRAGASAHLMPASMAEMQLPVAIGDYTDFYVGIHHATNIGRLFRPDNPLLPNYKYVPIGYHGRASSVRLSGAPVVRPYGQVKAPDAAAPNHAPTRRLDYELELGVWIGAGNALGAPIAIADAPRHVAGLCLLNDWSARDVQAWEYQPLGPFLAKNFLTSISPWVVTVEALAPFRVPQPARGADDPAPLPYLLDADDQASGAFSLVLEAHLTTVAMRREGAAPYRLSQGNSVAAMYWTIAQLVTHHSSNGCNLRPGDLLGTGTLSTADPHGRGSLIEITRGGKEPIALPTGERRAFLEDGDEVTITARAEAHGRVAIGFGACVGRVEAAPAARH